MSGEEPIFRSPKQREEYGFRTELLDQLRNRSDDEFFASLEKACAGNPWTDEMVAAWKVKKSQIEQIVALEKKGWSIVPNTIRVNADEATLKISLSSVEESICISFSKKKIL